jgi:hypothetical protein
MDSLIARSQFVDRITKVIRLRAPQLVPQIFQSLQTPDTSLALFEAAYRAIRAATVSHPASLGRRRWLSLAIGPR